MAVKTYTKGSEEKLSDSFNVSEFACHGNRCCTTVLIDEKLVIYLQKIRDHFGKPITITSGYRCPTHNRSVNGATSSRHAKGQACDIVVQGVAPREVAKFAESIGILGIGLYETANDGYFVHIDTRTSKSFWYGQKQAYRSTFGGASGSTTTTAPKPSTTTKPSVEATTAANYSLTQFVKDVQKACGAVVDGIAGAETLSKTVTISARKNVSHAAVKAVQKRLLALGYAEVGTADGIAGVKFTSAVAHFQQDNGCVVDGEVTAKNKTWRKLLGMK